MKNKIYALAALAAVAVPAWAEDVYSSNIVGYQKLTIHPEWTMIANTFNVVGTGDVANLNKMFNSPETSLIGGENESMSDNLQVWTGTSYSTYYFGDFDGEYGATYDNVWYDQNDSSGEPIVDDAIPAGNGAWFKNYSGTSRQLTISGEVPTNSVTVTIGPEWTMLSYPFPVDLPLNGVVDWVAAGVTGGENESISDNIQLWTGTTYKTYYFGDFDGEYGAEYDNVWYDLNDSSGEPTTDSIPAGNAVWFLNNGGTSFTITFDPPTK